MGRRQCKSIHWLGKMCDVRSDLLTTVHSLISGPQTFSDFFYLNEILSRNCSVQLMCYTSTFWKCILVWGYGEFNKSYEHECQKCHLKVLSIFSFGMVKRPVGWIAADFSPPPPPFPFKNSSLQRVCLLRIVTQRVEVLESHAFCHAQGWQANDISRATLSLTLARPNGAKIMEPKWRHVRAKNFPSEWARQNESKSHSPASTSWLLPIWPQKKILSSISISRDP